MRQDLLIGLDAGTSIIKAVAFTPDGRQIADAGIKNTYTSLPCGGVEQDMHRTWRDAAETLRLLGEKVENLGARALALGVTGQGDGTWLIDAGGAPLHDGWLWLDARAAQTAREIEASDGIETIYALTGTGINVCQMRTHLVWMKSHAPALLGRATSALHCKDWLYYKLTGMRATDYSEGLFTFGDYRKRAYAPDVLEALGLNDLRHLLPPMLDGSRETHALSEQAARETGLPAGLPVSLGAVDVVCSALGAGLYDADVQPGLSILGSTGMHMRFVPRADAIQLNPHRNGYTMAFPGGAYAQVQTNMAATLNIDWALGLAREILNVQGVACGADDLLDGLDERVLKARPGAALFHPYISAAGERGPFAEPSARASFTGLDQRTGWFDLLRAVYDGLVLAARDCYGVMGPVPREIRLTGGAGKSTALRKMLAAALNTELRGVAQAEAGAAGAAMMAAVAQGIYPDIGTAADAWVRPLLEPPIVPDPALLETYDTLFTAYRQTREAARPIWTAQAEMRRKLA